jgi:prepilin-type N-terminal cleavage/methylation domain-containing protein
MIATYQRLQKQRADGEISGFTLIELLIVIVVLGILAAVVIFALGGITGKSQLAACQADGATVSTALSAFKAQNPNVTAANITSAMLTSTTFSSGGNGYIQSWPNATSYAYKMNAGVLQVGNKSGTVTSGFINYKGPQTCGPLAKSGTSIGL